MRDRALILALTLLAWSGVHAQEPGRGAATRPTPRVAAPLDLTGYWVSIVTEDWRWRMVTPAKGDYASIPLNVAGLRLADTWDPAKDEAAGEQCRAYGAPGLMRGPTRLHITWLDDQTLKLEADYGIQTRLLHFSPSAASPAPSWQGLSIAEWVTVGGAGGRGRPGFGSMKSVTTRLRPGYLRKNGVPYGAGAVLTEHWDVHQEANGDRYLVDTMVVDDPAYLQIPWITSIHFKKEPDGGKWDPTPCSATF